MGAFVRFYKITAFTSKTTYIALQMIYYNSWPGRAELQAHIHI